MDVTPVLENASHQNFKYSFQWSRGGSMQSSDVLHTDKAQIQKSDHAPSPSAMIAQSQFSEYIFPHFKTVLQRYQNMFNT